MDVSQFLKATQEKKPGLQIVKDTSTFLRNLSGSLLSPTVKQDPKDQAVYRRIQENVNRLLNMVERKEILPTPALNQIAMMLLTLPAPPKVKPGRPCDPNKKPKGGVMIDSDGNEVIETVEEKERRSFARYAILLYCGDLDHTTNPKTGATVKSMRMVDQEWKEKSYQDAERKAARLLYKHEDSIEAHIIGITDGVVTKLTRGDAMALLFKKPKSPFCKQQVRSSKLGWGPRTKDYHQHFSKG